MTYPITDPALRWLETVLAERFDHEWHLSRIDASLCLQLAGAEGAIVFDALQDCFTEARSDLSFTQWDAEREGWRSVLGGALPAPGVADLPAPLIELRDTYHVIHYDILGLTYWMLARVEEIGRADLDDHQRFPASSSHAFQYSYLDRPVVDEWLHVLGQVAQRQWPGFDLKRHEFQMRVSHDVDRPTRYGFSSTRNLIRRMGGDVYRGKVRNAIMGPLIRFNTKTKLHPLDPDNTFNWIMSQSERHGLKSAFYFICGHSSRSMDGEYDIAHPALRDLLRYIHARGHEIGLHPSYNTYKNAEVLNQEAERLRSICAEEGIQQDEWGGRMHYLRWEHPTTLQAWNDAGMTYDSTLGYADCAGFRCGTCFDYPAFHAGSSLTFDVRVRPLIAMEVSVLSDKYMGLRDERAQNAFCLLKDRCRRVGGQFNLLWHNSEFDQCSAKKLYISLLT